MTQDNNKKGNKFSVKKVNMLAYNTPSILEKKSKDLIYFGVNNVYPFQLIDLYNESPTHNAIINGKVGYICGEGFNYDDEDLQKKALVSQFLDSANRLESWNALTKKLATDYELFNGYAIEVLRTRKGYEFYHLDFARTRRTLNVNILKYSDDWITEQGTTNARPTVIELPLFDEFSDAKRSVIYHADYRPNMDWYPLPIYQGSLAAIETDKEINNWWVNEIKNGFSGGTLITFNNGVPQTEEKKKEIEKLFRRKTSGSEKAGSTIIAFAADKDHAPTIESMSGNDLDKRYQQMSDTVQQNIFIGHRVTSPMLFGVKTEGQLGGRGEIDVAYDMFKKTYVQERQQTLLRTINKIMSLVLGFSGIEFKDFRPVETKQQFSEATIAEYLTAEEMRELISDQTGMQLSVKKEVTQRKMDFATANTLADSLEDTIIGYFERSGETFSESDIIYKGDIHLNALNEPQDIMFNEDFTATEHSAIKFLQANPTLSKAEMSKGMGMSFAESHNLVKMLQSKQLIYNDGIGWSLTLAGENTARIIDLPEPKTRLRIKYQYTLRDDALPTKTTSRPFCKALMSMHDIDDNGNKRPKLWSREEINLMRNDMAESGIAPQVTNVWLARGGWYRKPDEDLSRPFCRHVWKQVVVKIK
jgi:hypothetical protein